MACCGQKRESWRTAMDTNRPTQSGEPPLPRPSLSFEYTGDTALMVVGSITRQPYRFVGKGARLVVDDRDGPGLMAVPSLKRVRT